MARAARRAISLIVAYTALNLPLAVWMLKGYFDAIPEELEHCAMVDGATRWQAATKVTLPLIAPGIAAQACSSSSAPGTSSCSRSRCRAAMPAPCHHHRRVRRRHRHRMAADHGGLHNRAEPVLIATFALQRHIAAGMTSGAVKG